jgi:hypothetical protein
MSFGTLTAQVLLLSNLPVPSANNPEIFELWLDCSALSSISSQRFLGRTRRLDYQVEHLLLMRAP